MKRFFIFCTLFFIVFVGFSQVKQETSVVVKPENKDSVSRLSSGRVKGNLVGREAEKRNDKSLFAKDTLSMSDYMISIERVNDKLNTIRDSSKLSFEVVGMSRKSQEIARDISVIRQNIRGRNTVLNVRNLYLYQNLTSNLETENTRIQQRVDLMYDRCYRAKQHLRTVMSDSIFSRLYSDPVVRLKVRDKITRLERRWTRTDSLTRLGIDSLNAIKVRLADNCINLSGILTITDVRLDKSSRQLFGHEVNFLWENTVEPKSSKENTPIVTSIIGSEQKAIGYYFSQTSGTRIFVFVLGLLLFYWLFRKRSLLKQFQEGKSSFEFLHLYYLNSHPVLALFLVLFCLMPFFDAYAPISYIAIEHLLLLVFGTVIFYTKRDRAFFFDWLLLVILFGVSAITYLLVSPTFFERVLMLGIHVGTMVVAYRFYQRLDRQQQYYSWIRKASMVAIIVSALAVLFNLLGRFSLAGIFGITGIFAVTQAVVLPVFIEVIIEIVLLQIVDSRLKKGVSQSFDCSVVVKKIKSLLFFAAVLLWLIMLTSNLNIYHSISKNISEFLEATRTIGSISYKLISVTWFFAIIWMAHILQRLLTFIFGETGAETDDHTVIPKEKHSRLLITRLLVLIGGYLLAIAASGLPVDKLTFVLGALGVGIGMGLQNVVNNFVSGIILIFDGSLKIGDQIEVSGQTGKVKEIGLRASTLSTADGAEIIIPNGTILSQNITNWTYSNDEKRVVVRFSLTGEELDANVVNEIVNTTIAAIPNVIGKRKPVILYTKVTPETCWLTVRFWSSINNADEVKSDAMLRLNKAFSEHNIDYK